MEFKKGVDLSNFTTIKLGGKAKEFVFCESVEELKEALRYASEKSIKIWILGGGSNTIFSDDGFDGLVIKVGLRGMEFEERNGYVFAYVWAGESWDGFAAECVKRGYAGVEALSGIPGSVGATSIQNVGAYGQEVSEVIEKVIALNRESLQEESFSAAECEFGYRTSKFKKQNREKYIIIKAVYRLVKSGIPRTIYPELSRKVREKFGDNPTLRQARQTVIELRKSKSMALDSEDPNSVSCGSFFTNPCLPQKEFENLKNRNAQTKGYDEIPFFETAQHSIKIPAAWLIEQAGFSKGFKYKGAKISDNHCLALVNNNGTARDILDLAGHIKEKVKEKFGIELEKEPATAGFGDS